MEFFIDTANITEIEKAYKMGVISGVTTNPSLVAKEKKDFKMVIKEITEIVDGPISAEVISLKADEMYEEAIELAKIHKNIVIKLPITKDGLEACKRLSEKNIKTNVTLVFSVNQALLAARAGATYVSPFVGRLEDIGQSGILLIKDISDIFIKHNIETKIIAASLRNCHHIVESAKAGAHVGTIPYGVLNKMFEHQLTDAGIERFLADWNQK